MHPSIRKFRYLFILPLPLLVLLLLVSIPSIYSWNSPHLLHRTDKRKRKSEKEKRNNNDEKKILVEMKANQVISVNLNESKSASN